MSNGISILYVARDDGRWVEGAASPDETIARGLEAHGCKVVRRTESNNPKTFPKCDYLLYPKLRSYPSWVWDIGMSTICYYGDYRPMGHSDFDHIAKADHIFTNFDDGRGTWIPYPIWCDDYDPKKQRTKEWLWTGQKACYGGKDLKQVRDGDVDCLPPETVRYGWTPDTHISGWDYINAIETHKYGLSVSHDNNIYHHSSNRLGDYIAGGLTIAVRYFPGYEDMVPPNAFVYKDREELREFTKNPIPQDPQENHDYAREVWDARVAAKTMLENL